MRDVSKIKPGDVVGVRVLSIAATGAVEVRTEMDCSEWLHPSAIVSHTPAPKPALKVGDRVRAPVTDTEWKIVCLDPPYVHFGVQPGGNSRFPTRIDAVETWERLS